MIPKPVSFNPKKNKALALHGGFAERLAVSLRCRVEGWGSLLLLSPGEHSPELAGCPTTLPSPPEDTKLLSSRRGSPALTPRFSYDYFLQSGFRFVTKLKGRHRNSPISPPRAQLSLCQHPCLTVPSLQPMNPRGPATISHQHHPGRLQL